MSTNNAERHYPDGTDILMAAREDSERFHFRGPKGDIISVPALDTEQARQLAADEYRGFGPDDFEPVDADAKYDPDAYPDPVDSDREVNEHDLWMLTVAMRKGSRVGLQSHYSRKNPTDRTIGLLLDEWGDPADVPLADADALQQAAGIGPHRAAQIVGAAVSNRLIERARRPGDEDNDTELVTDGGQPVEMPEDLPEPPESEHTLHVFDTRDFDRTETLLEVQRGDTRKEAQAQISDTESTAPAFEDAEQTENGNYRGADLSKPMHATLEADESYPSLVYLGTLSEAAPHLYRLLAASDRPRSRWSVVTPTDVEATIGEWVGEIYDLANAEEVTA